MGNFIKLARKLGPGEIFDTINYIIGSHTGLSIGSQMDVSSLFSDFSCEVEEAHYQRVIHKLKTIENDDPALVTRIAEIYKAISFTT